MDNRTIAEQVFQLQLAIRYKNGTVASALQRAILGLLEYPHPLLPATPKKLLSVKGVAPTAAEWIARIIQGDSIESVAAEIPERSKVGMPGRRGSQQPDLGNWNGSWDDIVRVIEGE